MGRPGERQDRLERAQRKEKEDEDVPPAQFEVHSGLAPWSHHVEECGCGLTASRAKISTNWMCAALAGSRSSSIECASASLPRRTSSWTFCRRLSCSSDGR